MFCRLLVLSYACLTLPQKGYFREVLFCGGFVLLRMIDVPLPKATCAFALNTVPSRLIVYAVELLYVALYALS